MQIPLEVNPQGFVDVRQNFLITPYFNIIGALHLSFFLFPKNCYKYFRGSAAIA